MESAWSLHGVLEKNFPPAPASPREDSEPASPPAAELEESDPEPASPPPGPPALELEEAPLSPMPASEPATPPPAPEPEEAPVSPVPEPEAASPAPAVGAEPDASPLHHAPDVEPLMPAPEEPEADPPAALHRPALVRPLGNELPLGETVEMVAGAPDYRDRYPLGPAADYPSCRREVQAFLLSPDAAVVPSPTGQEMFRVPALHRRTRMQAVLVAPTTIGSVGLIFRDCPEFDPVPLGVPTDLTWTRRAGLRTVLCEAAWRPPR